MNDNEKLSLEQIRAFLEASEGTIFHSTDKRELYEWVNLRYVNRDTRDSNGEPRDWFADTWQR